MQARLAATLMAVMDAMWIGFVHLPQVKRHESEAADWTFLLLAVTLYGESWLVVAARCCPKATTEWVARHQE